MITDQLGRFFAFDVTLLTMFWYAAVIEVPRFLIGALYMAGREVLGLSPRIESISADGLASRTPTISVLLPGHNEGAGLERTILGLHEQTALPLQIVVIDDGSTDNMANVGRRLKARGLIDVFISTGLRGGKAAAQNLGLTYCKGDIIVVSDVDTSLDRDAIARLLEPFADPLVGAVSGNLGVRNFNRPSSPVSRPFNTSTALPWAGASTTCSMGCSLRRGLLRRSAAKPWNRSGAGVPGPGRTVT